MAPPVRVRPAGMSDETAATIDALEARLWVHLWNYLGNELPLARGLAKLGETRFRTILRGCLVRALS